MPWPLPRWAADDVLAACGLGYSGDLSLYYSHKNLQSLNLNLEKGVIQGMIWGSITTWVINGDNLNLTGNVVPTCFLGPVAEVIAWVLTGLLVMCVAL